MRVPASPHKVLALSGGAVSLRVLPQRLELCLWDIQNYNLGEKHVETIPNSYLPTGVKHVTCSKVDW